jgi:hypothetical protein
VSIYFEDTPCIFGPILVEYRYTGEYIHVLKEESAFVDRTCSISGSVSFAGEVNAIGKVDERFACTRKREQVGRSQKFECRISGTMRGHFTSIVGSEVCCKSLFNYLV